MIYKSLYFFSILLIGCQFSNDSKIVHPTEENLQVKKSNIIGPNSDLGTENNLDVLTHLDLIKEIGIDNENSDDFFGLISGVATDKNERVYVFDERQQLIKVYDSNGILLTTLGGRGRGPEEFDKAKGLAIYNNMWLLVSNGYRIDIYDIQNKEIEYLKSIAIDYMAGDLCVISNYLFINKFQVLLPDSDKEAELIVSYELPSFKKRISFGKPYLSENSMVVDRMSTGRVSCNEESEVVVYTFDKMPILHGYDSNTSELLWKSKIDEANYFSVIETNQGGKTTLTYEQAINKINDNVRSTITLNKQYELFQIDRRQYNENDFTTEQSVISYVIDSKTGIGKFIGNQFPLFRYISSEMSYSVNKDYTSLKIFRNTSN